MSDESRTIPAYAVAAMQVVAEAFGYSLEAFLDREPPNPRALVRARYLAAYVLVARFRMSHSKAGRCIGLIHAAQLAGAFADIDRQVRGSDELLAELQWLVLRAGGEPITPDGKWTIGKRVARCSLCSSSWSAPGGAPGVVHPETACPMAGRPVMHLNVQLAPWPGPRAQKPRPDSRLVELPEDSVITEPSGRAFRPPPDDREVRPLRRVQPAQPAPGRRPRSRSQYEIARANGFTGDTCGNCGSIAMVRSGTCQKCTICGTTTGCS